MTVRSGSLPAQTTVGPAAPRRMLWLLALLVVLSHWWLLDTLPRTVNVGPAMVPLHPTTLVFNTRRIEVMPAKAAQVPQTATTQPKPALIQKPKSLPPVVPMHEPLMSPTEVAGRASETPFAEPTPPLPAEPPEPVANSDTEADTAHDSTAARKASSPQAQVSLSIPGSVQLNYQMTGLSRGLNYHASGVMSWRQDGNRYEASMVVSAFLIGARSLSSVGDITVDGLAPKRFADKSRSELAAHFQSDKGKITFSANTPDAPWQRGAQDRLSVFFQLASLLAGQPEGFPPGTKIPMYTAGQKYVDTWTFSVQGSDDLNLPYGALTAIKLTRDARQEFDQRVEVWFAASLGYWPVRIKITQNNGDYIDQQLSSSGPP